MRAVIGAVLVLVGLPLLLAGAALWFAVERPEPAGGYAARLAPIHPTGYAVVVTDVDELLRRQAPFTRSGQTALRLTARTSRGPAFVGLAPAADVAGYLAGVGYTRLAGVRLGPGPLPVTTLPVAGLATPAEAPDQQPFWQASSRTGTLEWSPYELRGQRLALVVMDPDGRALLTVDLTARVHPLWLSSTILGLLGLGAALLLAAVVALAWPSRPREIVYLVPPARVPEIAARLGILVPGGPHAASPMPGPASPLPPPGPHATQPPPAEPPATGAPVSPGAPHPPVRRSAAGGPSSLAPGAGLADLEWPLRAAGRSPTAPPRVPAPPDPLRLR